MKKITKIIAHHAASRKGATAQEIDGWHKARWPGFTSDKYRNDKGQLYHAGYHYIIEASGKVVQTRGHDEEGAHTIGKNKSSIGICLSGNFNDAMPTKAQKDSFKKLAKKLLREFNLKAKDIVPHRRYSSTDCFGTNLPDDYFAKLVAEKEEDTRPDLMDQIERLQKLVAMLYQLIMGKKMSTKENASK